MNADASIEGVISTLVRESFGDAFIESVTVDRDFNEDGDEFFKITVVFDTGKDALDTHKVAGLVRHVRPKLFELNHKQFPVFRFRSKKDNAGLKREAA